MGLIITDNKFYSDIASAIRSKNGTANTYLPEEMASAIMSISGGGGITPTGTITISTNGMHNVYNYASASVSVPVGVFPSGTFNITSNNIYDITNYQSVSVSVPTGITPTGTITLSSNSTFNVTNYASAIVSVPEHPYALRYTDNTDFTSFTDNTITSIPYGAFALTLNLSSVYFPACTYIGSYAFAYCYKLNTVSFPLVKTISNYAFQYCSSYLSGASLTSAAFPSLTGTLGAYAFRGCQYIVGVDLPNVTSLGTQAFSGCSRIKSVNLSNLTVAGAGAFSYLTTCTDYSLPKLVSVYSSAFYSNWALTTLTLPSCNRISAYAFRYCSNLMSLYLTGSTIPALTSTAFANMPFSVSVNNVFGSIYVPSSLLASYKAATNWATYSARIVAI